MNAIGAMNVVFAKEKNLLIVIRLAADALREDVRMQSAATFQPATDWHSKAPRL